MSGKILFSKIWALLVMAMALWVSTREQALQKPAPLASPAVPVLARIQN